MPSFFLPCLTKCQSPVFGIIIANMGMSFVRTTNESESKNK